MGGSEPTFKHPSLSVYAFALSMQSLTWIMTLFCINPLDVTITDVKTILYDSTTQFYVLGILGIILTALILVTILFGYFVNNSCLCLLRISTAFNTLYCIGMAIYLGMACVKGQPYYSAVYQAKIQGDPSIMQDLSDETIFYGLNLEFLVYGAAGAIAASLLFSKASSVRKSSPPAEVGLMVPSSGLSTAVGGFLVYCTKNFNLNIFGYIFFGFALLEGFALSMRHCKPKSVCGFLAAVTFLLALAFNLTALVFFSNYLLLGRDDYIASVDSDNSKYYATTIDGTFLLIPILFIVSKCIVIFLSLAYTVRELLQIKSPTAAPQPAQNNHYQYDDSAVV